MKSTKTLILAATMLALPIVFTSCDDILGEWSRPAPVTPSDGGEGGTTTPKAAGTISFASASLKRGTSDPIINALTKTGDGVVTYSSSAPAVATVDPNTGEVTPVAVGTTTITATVSDSEGYTYAVKSQSYDLTLQEAGYSYLKWNDGTKQVEQAFVSDNIVEVTNTTNTTWNDASKIYVVKGSVTLSNITVSANSTILLCDGATFTVTGGIDGGNTKDLTIYAQSEGEGMGELNVSRNDSHALKGKSIEIHGGKLTVTATGNNAAAAIYTYYSLSIYGGDITAQGASNTNNTSGYGGEGICNNSTGAITISGKTHVSATGGKSTTTHGGTGILNSSSGGITISGDAHVTATGGEGKIGGQGMASSYSGFTAKENAVVTITGGISTNGDGVIGAHSSSNFVINGANVTIKGGNAGGTGNYNGGPACERIEYQSGKFFFVGGAGSGSGTNGKTIENYGLFKNSSGADATFQYSTDGSAWTDFTVTAGSSDNSEKVRNRYLRTK